MNHYARVARKNDEDKKTIIIVIIIIMIMIMIMIIKGNKQIVNKGYRNSALTQCY